MKQTQVIAFMTLSICSLLYFFITVYGGIQLHLDDIKMLDKIASNALAFQRCYDLNEQCLGQAHVFEQLVTNW